MAECPSSTTCGNSAACSSCSSNPGLKTLNKNKKTHLEPTIRNIKHTLFIVSGKGGVGKSAVTVNIAVALANQGRRVGILDVDMHGPSVPSLLGIERHIAVKGDDTLIPPTYKDKIAVVSMDSFLADRNTAVIWRGPKKTAAINQFLSGVAWGDLDYLLIDSPPGTGDEHLAVLRTIPTAACVMVTTPQEISLADVRKALHFLERVNANVLGLIENMSGLDCPHCGGSIDLFSSGGGEKLAKAKNIPFLGRIPIDPAMLAAADSQHPVTDLPGDFPSKRAFVSVAQEISRMLPI